MLAARAVSAKGDFFQAFTFGIAPLRITDRFKTAAGQGSEYHPHVWNSSKDHHAHTLSADRGASNMENPRPTEEQSLLAPPPVATTFMHELHY